MKFFVILLIFVSSAMVAPNVFAWCPQNEDWSDRPCYTPYQSFGIEKERSDWAPYYDFKGSEWMESKKQEMTQAIQNDTLSVWIKLTSETQAHRNVHEYYFIFGEVPNLNGEFIDESYKPIESIEKHKFINFLYTQTIGEPIKFILEKTRDGNCNSYNAEITDDDGNFVWGGGADIDCDSASISSGVSVQTKIGYNENHPIIINDSGKYYLEVKFDDVFIKREFTVRQNHSGVNIDNTDYSNSQEFLHPLKQIKNGISLIDVKCNEGKIKVVKHDRMSVACVNNDTEVETKLIERGWATMRFHTEEDTSAHALCNNYEGKWHSEYEGCRGNITNLQCSLMGGKFVDGLKICYDGICPVDKTYTLCVTDSKQPDSNELLPKLSLVSELNSEIKMKLNDAKKLLETAYYENVNLGPLKINDVIVGFGIENDVLIIDVLYRYSTSSEMDIVKKKIRDIVGDEIKIEYVSFKTPPSVIEMAMPYHWNEYLHKNNIEFVPANTSYGNNDDGIDDGTFLCSPLVAPNGTKFYIVSTVIVEPFLITDTFIDIEKPEFCRKTWKTDVILSEPDRVTSLWLAMGQGKIPN